MRNVVIPWVMAVFAGFSATPAKTADVVVAIAANFATTAQHVIDQFEEQTGHHVLPVHGSTGKLYAQILNGAPFDVFLAADSARPVLLEQGGITQNRATYAIGKLVFLRTDGGGLQLDALTDEFPRLAIADPQTAPYGLAAKQTLVALRGPDHWDRNVVFGESVGQASGFIATGNAQAGLVALSQVGDLIDDPQFSEVSDGLYQTLEQQAVLMKRGGDNPAAIAFFDFLTSPVSVTIIQNSGYGVVD